MQRASEAQGREVECGWPQSRRGHCGWRACRHSAAPWRRVQMRPLRPSLCPSALTKGRKRWMSIVQELRAELAKIKGLSVEVGRRGQGPRGA